MRYFLSDTIFLPFKNMDVHHVDDELKKKQHIQSIFSVFVNLFSEKGRNSKEFVTLLKSISNSDVTVGSGGNLQYSIRRFVRGLTSAHSHPQCASFAALCCFLKYELTSVNQVLDILDAELKGNFSRSQQGALNSGCILTCGAIIHSGVYPSLPSETKEKIINRLISTGKTKNYLSAATHKFLVDLVCMIDEKDFKNVLWPICKNEIKSNTGEPDVNHYDFLLVCHNRFPQIVDKFILKLENSFQLFIEKILTLLVNSHVAHDDSVYDRVCQVLVGEKKLLLKLWESSVENACSSKNSFRRRIIITLFCYIMKHLKHEKLVPKLLLPKFIEIIIMILSYRKTKKTDDYNCHTLAKSCLDLLVNSLIKEEVPSSVRFKAIEKLMFYPANMKFEKKTGTKCIHSLIMHLNASSLKELAKIHNDIISGNLKKIVDKEGNCEDWNNNEKQFVLHIFVKLLHHPAVKSEKEWKLEQIKFLFDIGFIRNGKIHSNVQKCARDCFYKAIEVQMPTLEAVIELLDELLVYVNDKIENKILELAENATESWNKVFTTVQKLKKSKDKLFIAIHLLLIHMGLQLFSDSNLAIFNIDELIACYSRLKKSKSGEDLHWSEVTVDLMLSLLSRENKLWRYVVCNLAFPQMVKHLTPLALHQIIDVLNPQSDDRLLNEEQSDGSEDDEDDNGDENDEAEEEEEEEEDDEEEKMKSESSLTESENDENITMNDQLRLAVKEALGMSAALTDQESVDMDEMDEEEERKLNERLSAAFRMFKANSERRKKKQTKKEKALTHFRFRVLDLVEIYLTNGPNITGCLDLLFPLFNLLELSIKDANQRIFFHRVDSILKKLSSLKNFPDAEIITEKLIVDHFDALLNRKEVSNLIFVEMAPRISDCCTFLVRCSQMIQNQSDTPLVSNYKTLLDNFFRSRDNKLPISLFQSAFRSAWPGSWKLISILFDLLVDPSIKLFKKMKAIELLDIFYKNSKLHSAGDNKNFVELNQIEAKFITDFIEYLKEYQNKKVKTNEKMFFAFFAKILSLVSVANKSFNRHRTSTRKPPEWKFLISKLAEIELVLTNKKSRKLITNLGNLFDVNLPKMTPTVSQSQEEDVDEEDEAMEEIPKKRKKMKRLSTEKIRMKKESLKLRQAMGNEGIDMVPFSVVDVYTIPDGVNDVDPPEPPPKKRKPEEVKMNGNSTSDGYANEVGEAFRSIVPRYVVNATYGVASLYVLADTYDKSRKEYDKEIKKPKSGDMTKVAKVAIDTLSWQALASIIIPGFVINRICAFSLYTLGKTPMSCTAVKWMTTAIGLSSIPFIVKPIDSSVDYAFDKSIRPFLGIPPKHSD